MGDVDSEIKQTKPRFSTKKIVLPILVFLVIFGAGVAFVAINKSNQINNIAYEDACGGTFLDEAVSVLAPINYSKKLEIEQLYNKVKTIDNYEKFPNCVYPAFQYYVSVGDLANAIGAFKIIEARTQEGAPYAGDRFMVTIDTMRELTRGFEKTVESLNSSSGSGGFGAKTE